MLRASLIEEAILTCFEPLLANEPAPVVAAFSGGPDSTALLLALRRVAPRLSLELHAAHLDHGLDPDAARRAAAARQLAEDLGVPVTIERRAIEPATGESLEAAARRVRYAFLERVADEKGAPFIATAHHADDQAETVLLRLAFGSGLGGMTAIQPRHGRWVRPFLGLRRAVLADARRELAPEMTPVEDPTNRDLAVPRNRLRHHLLPRLEDREPGTVERLCRLATAARRARGSLERRFERSLKPRALPGEAGIEIDRSAFEALPAALWPQALAWLHRRAGVSYPAAATARAEFLRQMGADHRNEGGSGGRVGCDCGGGWRWEAASGKLQLVRGEYSVADFSYTLGIPGAVTIPEIGSLFRLRRGKMAPWMFSQAPDRAGMAVAGGEHAKIEVRNRRPGDRVVPLGSRRRQRLKKLLIDRRVPRRERSRLPLLIIDGEIAWVPGITLSERHRLSEPRAGTSAKGEEPDVWIAEIERIFTGQGR